MLFLEKIFERNFKNSWIGAPSISNRREETISNSRYRGNENAGRCIQGGGSSLSVGQLRCYCYCYRPVTGYRVATVRGNLRSKLPPNLTFAREKEIVTFKRKENSILTVRLFPTTSTRSIQFLS